mmetsp:Transcript_69983/g.111292  ORF Transcript_69983/g.111292 Transcript_69983/m.111292 type:complete len:309 (-) Transcript_69983:979-1905(-)
MKIGFAVHARLPRVGCAAHISFASAVFVARARAKRVLAGSARQIGDKAKHKLAGSANVRVLNDAIDRRVLRRPRILRLWRQIRHQIARHIQQKTLEQLLEQQAIGVDIACHKAFIVISTRILQRHSVQQSSVQCRRHAHLLNVELVVVRIVHTVKPLVLVRRAVICQHNACYVQRRRRRRRSIHISIQKRPIRTRRSARQNRSVCTLHRKAHRLLTRDLSRNPLRIANHTRHLLRRSALLIALIVRINHSLQRLAVLLSHANLRQLHHAADFAKVQLFEIQRRSVWFPAAVACIAQSHWRLARKRAVL